MRAIEYGSHDLPSQILSRPAHVDFQNLSDIHSGGNAQRVQHDIERSAVGQERHILLRQDAGDDALVTMAASHLITHGDLTLLSDIATDDFVHAGAHLIAVGAGEHLNLDNNSVLTVRHAHRGIAHLACLLAEDCTQQPLLRCQLCFALRCHLTDEDVAGTDLRTDADHARLVKILQSILGDVWNITGNIFRPELCIACLHFIFLDMDGGKYVVTNHFSFSRTASS